MIDKKNTVILLDNNSTIGKVVRLIMDRNCDLRDGYDFHQHNRESTYFPGSNDKKFILVGDIFDHRCLEDIKRKDPDFKRILLKEDEGIFNPIGVLTNLWHETNNGKTITDQEADNLQRVSRIFDYESIPDPSGEVMKTYIDNFVTILTSGNEFFNTPYLNYFEMVDYYNKNPLKFIRDEIHPIEQHFIDEKKFFEPNTYQIVLDFKGKDLEEVLLGFYKKYPDLKEHFNLIQEVKEGVDISSIMEQKLLLESLHLANVEYYNQHIKKSEIKNVVNESILDEIKTTVNKIRNRIIVGWNKL